MGRFYLFNYFGSVFRSCLLVWTLIFPFISLAQSYLRYDNYTQSKGLSDNYVNCIFQDSRGFVWVGTWNGLNRFDGFEFKKYVSDKSNPQGMQGDWVLKIYEDQQKNLWVCTSTELMKYDWKTDKFSKIRDIDTMSVHDLIQDRAGFLWISTEAGLFKYDSRRNLIIQRFSISGSPRFPSDKLTHLVLDDQDNLWIGSMNTGLIHFNIKTYESKVFEMKSKDFSSSHFYNIRWLVFDKRGKLWMMGKYNFGLAIFDTLTKTFTYKRHDPSNSYSIPTDAVSQIAKDNNGDIWICSQNESLCRYDYRSDRFFRYDYDHFIPTSLNAQSASCIYTDKLGNFWVGSHGNGIFFLNSEKNIFKSYGMKSKKGLTLPSNIISSFTEMSDGKILVATDGGGFCEFDREKETFVTYNEKNGLQSDAVTKILATNDENVWLASWNGGLDKFNYKTKKFEHFRWNPANKFSLIHNNLKDVYPNDANSLWVVTHGQGLTLLNLKEKKFISHHSGVKTPFDYSAAQWGNSVMKDSKGRLWISSSALLGMYDGKKFTSYNTSKINQQKRSSNAIYMTYEDYRGKIWIVTDKAIDIFNEKENNFERFEAIKGMPKNPKAIIEDLHHRLWISSSEGLACLDAKRKTIQAYSLLDGLPSKDFVARSAYRLKDGTLMFGGTFGFIMFHPDSLYIHPNKPLVVLNDLYVNHDIQLTSEKNQYLQKALQSTDTISYAFTHDVISFKISGVDFSNPDKINYAYKIQGLSDSWIPLGNERSLTLPSLDPGTYTLLVKAYKSDTIYSLNGNGLTIIVLPLWWQTVWFKILVVILVVLIVFMIIRFRIREIEEKNRLLEKLVEEKTQYLHESIEDLNEAKITIEMKNSELLESIALKDKLIAIIAHDIKSPLSAISGLVDLIKLQTNSISREKLRNYIHTISDSAQKLEINLGMMINWAHSSFKNLTHNPSDIHLVALLNDVVGLMKENSRQKGVSISIQSDIVHNAYVDPRMIHTVFLNLLSNALKFTHPNGAIVISIQELGSMLEVSIIDTGIGMNKEQIDRIFSDSEHAVSTLGTQAERGFGFGLQICQQFVQKNKGTISVKSHEGNGSVFTVNLPMAQTIAESVSVELGQRNDLVSDESEITTLSKKYSILIIDDDEELLTMLHAVFESNCTVFKASDGKSGLHIAQNLLPDIIVVDIKLQGISGLEVCAELKKNSITAHIPIIVISGESIQGLEEECYRAGAMGFLAKPFSGRTLKSKVFSVLENIYQRTQQVELNHPQGGGYTLPESSDDHTIRNIIDLLTKNIENSECDIETLASELGLSRTQFWRKTKSILGKTPIIILRDLRLSKASEMIKSGKFRVSDVAYHVGFSDPSYFTRAFTKYFGMSPSEYYEVHKGQEV